MQYLGAVARAEYDHNKYVRIYNRPEYAKYLGYLGARELYSEFEPRSFKDLVVEFLDGKIRRPYSGLG